MANVPISVSNILDQLATTSSRPRYAFAVLALLAEQAGPTGKTGPFITDADAEKLPLRDYHRQRLQRMSRRGIPRPQLESRIRDALQDVRPAERHRQHDRVGKCWVERVHLGGRRTLK